MAKSPKKEQGKGKKFQDRMPGEKRNRKIDLLKSESKKTQIFTEKKADSGRGDSGRPPRSDSGFSRGEGRNFTGGARSPRPFGDNNSRPPRSDSGRGDSGRPPRSDSGRVDSGRPPRPDSGFSRGEGRNFKQLDKSEEKFYSGKSESHSQERTKRLAESPVYTRTKKSNTSPLDKNGLEKFAPRGEKEINEKLLRTGSKNSKAIIEETKSNKQDNQNRRQDAANPHPISSIPPANIFKPKTYGISKKDKEPTPKAFKGSRREFGRVSENLEKGTEHLNSGEIRLNRYIANSGVCSRREADNLIVQGLVYVNELVINELGTKIKSTDSVRVENRKITPEKPVYILMNKPKGYITTTTDPEGRKTVIDLIDLPGKERIYPVGRLDRNTTGVLLLTNDGELSQKLMHPSFEIKKVYKVTLDKKPSKEHMLAWVEGVKLEDGMMAFEQCGFVEEGKENVFGVEIKSGRNRIVRRMFEHFQYEVSALDRVLVGEFDKTKLARGKWRFLSEQEFAYIERLKRSKPKAVK